MELPGYFARQKSPEGIAAHREYSQGEAGLHRLAGWSFDGWEKWREQFQKEFSLHWPRFVKGHSFIMGLPAEAAFTGSAADAYTWMEEHLKLIQNGWNPNDSRAFLYDMFERIQVLIQFAVAEQNEPYRRLSRWRISA